MINLYMYHRGKTIMYGDDTPGYRESYTAIVEDDGTVHQDGPRCYDQSLRTYAESKGILIKKRLRNTEDR